MCGAGYAAKGDFENMVTYSTAHGYKPDYLYLMQRMMMDNPEAAVSAPGPALNPEIICASTPPAALSASSTMRTSIYPLSGPTVLRPLVRSRLRVLHRARATAAGHACCHGAFTVQRVRTCMHTAVESMALCWPERPTLCPTLCLT